MHHVKSTNSYHFVFVVINFLLPFLCPPGDCDRQNNSEECTYDGGDVSMERVGLRLYVRGLFCRVCFFSLSALEHAFVNKGAG